MSIAPHHLDALGRLGYTREEAGFLYVVAIHSGYFTRRQFLRFAGIERGQRSQNFLHKLLSEQHASAHTYQMGARVFHLFSRRIFNAIGHENLRTRRKHQLDYIKTRLMALDFVLANRDCEYLETEGDKVPFFEERIGVERSLLPSRTYGSKVSAKTTTRYFVDRFPLYIKDANSAVPTFTYLDPGFATASGFRTHCQAYLGLFRALGQFDLIYVGASEDAFSSAGLEFSSSVAGEGSESTRETLLRYFALRRTWEEGGRVAAADVVLLNRARHQFRSEAVESVYRKWREQRAEEPDFASVLGGSNRRFRGRLFTVVGGESLSAFHRKNRETEEADDGEAGSSACSPSGSPV